jgi:hypothetical protein
MLPSLHLVEIPVRYSIDFVDNYPLTCCISVMNLRFSGKPPDPYQRENTSRRKIVQIFGKFRVTPLQSPEMGYKRRNL